VKYVWIGIAAVLLFQGCEWVKAKAPERKIISLPAPEWICTDREKPHNECWEYRRIAPRSAAQVPHREISTL